VQRLLAEAREPSLHWIVFARHRSATTGDRVGKLIRQGLGERRAFYDEVRAAATARLDELGGVGPERGLLLMAARLATAEAIDREQLTCEDQIALRRLWSDMRSR
jgi:hypothetical protein